MKICFASIVGRPNVGKSSLLNAIVGFNVAIVTDTAQTTRDQITGIYTEGDEKDGLQIIFTDTPGIHKPLNKLGEVLNKNAFESLKNIDVVLFLSPADEVIGKGDEMIIDKIKDFPNKIAVISKIDKIKSKPELLLQKIDSLKELGFDNIISTDVKDDKSVYALIDEIAKFSQEGQPQYDLDYVTDKTVRFLAKEIIRESAINALYDELPHSIAVEVNEFNELEQEDGSLRYAIDAIIYVKKASQKGMVIGKSAEKIKQIGKTARYKITKELNAPTTLTLKVKVAKKWINDPDALNKFGYN
ncbi:GTPase Era [Mycoplasma nasistruthionis]|uniref:GTPase Era n=1 Tax=Mycoplasma nasistruthionis TaxID=353852 RepID=A0A5B7XXJ5_9MOLU|nr:GTPase Era [Mycoplasma nasistruthionis]QCZ36643.1 GTPase Era [Mycoplasma nasistruthionis]